MTIGLWQWLEIKKTVLESLFCKLIMLYGKVQDMMKCVVSGVMITLRLKTNLVKMCAWFIIDTNTRISNRICIMTYIHNKIGHNSSLQ